MKNQIISWDEVEILSSHGLIETAVEFACSDIVKAAPSKNTSVYEFEFSLPKKVKNSLDHQDRTTRTELTFLYGLALDHRMGNRKVDREMQKIIRHA